MAVGSWDPAMTPDRKPGVRPRCGRKASREQARGRADGAPQMHHLAKHSSGPMEADRLGLGARGWLHRRCFTEPSARALAAVAVKQGVAQADMEPGVDPVFTHATRTLKGLDLEILQPVPGVFPAAQLHRPRRADGGSRGAGGREFSSDFPRPSA